MVNARVTRNPRTSSAAAYKAEVNKLSEFVFPPLGRKSHGGGDVPAMVVRVELATMMECWEVWKSRLNSVAYKCFN